MRLSALRIRYPDGRLEPVRGITGRLDGPVLDTLRAALPVGADLIGPGEHQPATAYHMPDPVA